jgi:hypothetical protein
MILNTDYRKYDESLRMILAGSAAQRNALDERLRSLANSGKIKYGIHAAKGAVITCLVGNYSNNHVHFLDAAGGGYAKAALQMKKP